MGALSVYLDTSVIVSLFINDSFSPRARAFLATGPADIVVSDLASAEFASALGIRCRRRLSNKLEARAAFASLDIWSNRYAVTVQMQSADIRQAQSALRRLDLSLRTPDAIHIAIAQRLGSALATFDNRLADGAKTLGAALAAV